MIPKNVQGLLLSPLCVMLSIAQDVLPFPVVPSGSQAGITMQDSIYKKRVVPPRLEKGAPNILIILMDDGHFIGIMTKTRSLVI